MSASEKLKALESAGWYAVLSEIVAVVEAAEPAVLLGGMAELDDLRDALAALDKALK